MASVVEKITVSIRQSNSNPPTCFALPGTSGVNPSWSNVNGTITLKAMDNEHLYMDCDIDVTDSVLTNNYPVIFGCRNQDWRWSYGGGDINIPSGFKTISRDTVSVTGGDRGDFRWNIRKTNIDLGLLSDWGANVEGDNGFMWISGTGTYNMANPIYPDPYKLTVPGFVKLFDYYPFAVRKGGVWKSCNRDGGSTTIRKGGSWRDVKNSHKSDSDSQAFYRDGSSWKRTPDIGEGA